MTSKTKLNLVNNDLFETDPIFTLVDFPSRKQADTLPIKDFLQIKTFPLNRDVEKRASKTTVNLTTPMHKQNEIDIAIYTGSTVTEPAYFQKGEMYVLDGNTRQYIWKNRMNGNMVNTKVKSIPIPKNVVVNYYEFDDANEAYSVYKIIDSADAVETKPDLITGAFRAKNLLGNFKNKKMQRGSIGTALNTACPYGPRAIYEVIQPIEVTNLNEQVTVLQDVLVAIDKLDAPGKGVLSTQLSLGIAMLAGVAMGANNTQWLEAVETLRDYNSKNQQDVIASNDGIYYLIKGQEENICGKEFKNALPYNTGLFNDRKTSLDYIAYCWTKIINDEEMAVPSKIDVKNAYVNLLRQAWDNVDE
jgi:hypothetical protein